MDTIFNASVTEPPSICYLADANSPHTHRWVAPVAADGATVTIVSYRPVSTPPADARIIDLTRINNTPRLRFVIWTFWLRRFLRTLRPDILHAHQLQAAGWLGSLSGFRPFVATAWGSDLLQTPFRSPAARRWVSAVLRRCDVLTVPSPHMSAVADGLCAPAVNTRVIPWGVDTGVFNSEPDDCARTRARLGVGEDASLLFCPRAITPTYRIDVVLRAFAALRQERPEARLALIRYQVDDSYMAKLEAMQADLALSDSVIWLPPQREGAAMAELYRASDIVVSVPLHEGYGSSMYEAMACARPTIISDVPSLADVPDDVVAARVAPGSVAETTDALSRLMETPERRIAVGGRAARYVRQMHNVANRIAATKSLYDQLLKHDPSRVNSPAQR